MKLGVSSYSFVSLIRSGAMDEFEVVKTAAEMGFEVIEFSGLHVPENMSPIDYAKQIKDACKTYGIGVGNYTIGADFINGSNGDREAEVERVKGEVDIAYALGSTSMRHDATSGFNRSHGAKTFDSALPILSKACRAVTEYAQDKGIKTMVENHGFFFQDSIRVEKLIGAVDHENFGALVDIGNFLCVDENPIEAVGRLMPAAVHVHAKDFHVKSGANPFPGKGWFQTRGGNYLRGSIIGHGDVPVSQCLRIIKNSGYDGVLSIEFEGMEEPIMGITLGFENLKRFLAEA